MKQKNKKIKSLSEINFENEIRKAKMQLEKGAKIQSSGNIPPEIESLFLDQIEKIDKAYKKAGTISVFEKTGSIKFKSVDKIDDKEIKKELNALLNKMIRKGIIVDSICNVDDREMYRFITEELFNKKIDNISIKGMITHFIYEEFHPNHEYDVKCNTEDFIKEIFSNKNKVDNFFLDEKIKTSSGKMISAKNALEKINLFRSFYSKFEINKFEFSNVIVNSQNSIAETFFELSYTVTIDGTSEKQIFSGQGKSALKKNNDVWMINQFEMPGLIISP